MGFGRVERVVVRDKSYQRVYCGACDAPWDSAAPVAEDSETRRLELLRRLSILDTPPEQSFDEIVLVAAHLCEAPTALITFVDDTRCWFKAKSGIDGTHTPRNVSFCNHLVGHDAPLIVEDAEADERFRDNPLVTSAPGIRFYAGVPLIREGAVLGALCVVDFVPRTLTDLQLEALNALGRHVGTLLELREALLGLRAITQDLERANAALAGEGPAAG